MKAAMTDDYPFALCIVIGLIGAAVLICATFGVAIVGHWLLGTLWDNSAVLQ